MAFEGICVLVIDDDRQIRKMLALSLGAHGFRVLEAGTAADGLSMVADRHPDLAILDLGLPDMDGLEALRKLREWSAMPVIVLSVRTTEEDKVRLLDAGANDYLTKPFGMGELLARIRAALRGRLPGTADGVLTAGRLSVDCAGGRVKVDGKGIKLTPTEFALLRYLAVHAGKIVTHRQLINELWGPEAQPDQSYLRVYILQLRRKIEENPSDPRIIVTEPGIGFRLVLSGDGD